jgi:hypothetical protein
VCDPGSTQPGGRVLPRQFSPPPQRLAHRTHILTQQTKLTYSGKRNIAQGEREPLRLLDPLLGHPVSRGEPRGYNRLILLTTH